MRRDASGAARDEPNRDGLGDLGVAAREIIIDFDLFVLNKVVADFVEFRRFNPQRLEMEQLSAVADRVVDERLWSITIPTSSVTWRPWSIP